MPAVLTVNRLLQLPWRCPQADPYLRAHTYNAHVACSPCRRVPDFATLPRSWTGSWALTR